MTMTRVPGRWRSLRLAIVSLVAAAAAGACQSPPREAVAARAAIAVQTAPAAVRVVNERLEAGGVVAAGESAVLASRIVAAITEVRVRAGDTVAAGDVLAALDARDITALARQAVAAATAAERALAQAASQRTAAAAEQTLAAAWRQRIATLRDRNSATVHELDEADARLATAAARVSGAEAGVQYATEQLAAHRAAAEAAATTESFAIIRAPFAGLVTERFTDPGNLAAPGTPLLRIESGARRRVEVRVDESRVGYVNPGDRVAIVFDAAGGLDAAADLDGTVTEVGRAVDADRRAFTVKVALPPGHAPRTGTFARVRFAGASRRAVVVPAGALRRNGQVASVFVVADGRARVRLVQAGETTPDGIEIVSGVDEGEAVVVQPPPALTDGHPVTARVTVAGADAPR